MSTYVIGDIHGCFDELQSLLKVIDFDQKEDCLWFTGDLVNDGPKPVETLEFIKNLGNRAICTLGNHDLTLLGIDTGCINISKDRRMGFEAVLTSKNKNDLLSWLKARPLIHYDAYFNIFLVHAGIAPQWNKEKALALANEVENILISNKVEDFFSHIYGNEPNIWNDHLSGWPRIRCIINYMTRMRFCSPMGHLYFNNKGPANTATKGTLPWYDIPNCLQKETKIVFGHWASILGKTNNPDAIALDTGCVWGHYLTALRLEDQCIFQISC